MKFPKQGKPRSEIQAAMREMRAKDANWREGRTFSLVYHAGDELTQVLQDAYLMFFAENGLSPIAFPSLRRFPSKSKQKSYSLICETVPLTEPISN